MPKLLGSKRLFKTKKRRAKLGKLKKSRVKPARTINDLKLSVVFADVHVGG